MDNATGFYPVNGGSIPSSRTKFSPDPLQSFKSLETMHDAR